ncbi:unnamed protein product, partial [Prorocentrum cordatum]
AEWNKLEPLKQNEIMKAAMRLHRNTGHRLPRAMIKVPRRGGATAVTIAAAKQIKRSSCFENQASKLTLAVKIFSRPGQGSRNCAAKELLGAFRSHWSDRYGIPAALRHDPKEANVSRGLFGNISSEGAVLDPRATRAHWQKGIAERAIQTFFERAKSLHRDHYTDMETAVHQAAETHNTVERVDGYSPTQWAFGRDEKWPGTFTKDESLD